MEDQERGTRMTFSISNEFSDVKTILNSVPKNARSRYICEAIREKYERESNPHSIENQIRAMLTHILHAEQYAQQIQQTMAKKQLTNGQAFSQDNQGKPMPFLYHFLSGLPMFQSMQQINQPVSDHPVSQPPISIQEPEIIQTEWQSDELQRKPADEDHTPVEETPIFNEDISKDKLEDSSPKTNEGLIHESTEDINAVQEKKPVRPNKKLLKRIIETSRGT